MKVVYKGKKYDSLQLICDLLGINPDRVYAVRCRLHLPLEEAIEYACSRRRKSWTDHLGNAFISLREMADFYQLPLDVIRARLGRRWNLKRALTTPVGKPRGHKSVRNLRRGD